MYACVYNVHIYVYIDANTIIEGKINVTSAKFLMFQYQIFINVVIRSKALMTMFVIYYKNM